MNHQFLKDPSTDLDGVATPFLDAILDGYEQRKIIVTYDENGVGKEKTIVLTKYANSHNLGDDLIIRYRNPDDLEYDATAYPYWNDVAKGIIDALLKHDGSMEWQWSNSDMNVENVECVRIELLDDT